MGEPAVGDHELEGLHRRRLLDAEARHGFGEGFDPADLEERALARLVDHADALALDRLQQALVGERGERLAQRVVRAPEAGDQRRLRGEEGLERVGPVDYLFSQGSVDALPNGFHAVLLGMVVSCLNRIIRGNRACVLPLTAV